MRAKIPINVLAKAVNRRGRSRVGWCKKHNKQVHSLHGKCPHYTFKTIELVIK